MSLSFLIFKSKDYSPKENVMYLAWKAVAVWAVP